jgi:hypothetical protein
MGVTHASRTNGGSDGPPYVTLCCCPVRTVVAGSTSLERWLTTMLFLEQLFFLAFLIVLFLVLGVVALWFLLTGFSRLIEYYEKPPSERNSLVRYSRPNPARRARQLSETADFTLVVSQLQSALTRRAHSEALASITELDAILARYKAAGQLPPELEAELEAFLARNTAAFAGLSDDVGRALAALIGAYVPPTKRLQYWWYTSAQPWLRNLSR